MVEDDICVEDDDQHEADLDTVIESESAATSATKKKKKKKKKAAQAAESQATDPDHLLPDFYHDFSPYFGQGMAPEAAQNKPIVQCKFRGRPKASSLSTPKYSKAALEMANMPGSIGFHGIP